MNNRESNKNIIIDNNGKLDVISSIRNNVMSNNCRVIKITEIPVSLNMDSVRKKTNDVINRVNKMICLEKEKNKNNDNKLKFSIRKNKSRVNKKAIKEMIGNKNVIVSVLVLTFIFTFITVGKTFSLRNKVNEYDEIITDIEKKQDTNTKVYQENKLSIGGVLSNSGAVGLVNCINSSINVDNLPDSIESIIDEINDYYNQSNNYFAFKYKDIYTGFSISYNEKQAIFAASTIKAPKDIYIYEMASKGFINLDEELVYTNGYYNTGTGILKDKEFNTKYSIRKLVEYSTVHSDNAAHNMLMDKYGKENMLSFWKNKGTKIIFNGYDNWGNISAHDASIYMDELYKFYLENDKYGKELMNNFINTTTKFITGKNNYKVANKSGWSGSAMHDVSIVFADNPYIVVALSYLGTSDNYWQYFNKANDLAYRLHTEYWKYKMSICNDISQY